MIESFAFTPPPPPQIRSESELALLSLPVGQGKGWNIRKASSLTGFPKLGFTSPMKSDSLGRRVRHAHSRGFTLIELAMVLVVIGLLTGGILYGRDLIGAAGARAQITQIEKFNTAANTFRDKYGGLPGDLAGNLANQFGFAARGQYTGEGDGNGVIEGITADAPSSQSPFAQGVGETAMFWVDLSQAKLISQNFNSASSTSFVSYAVQVIPQNNNYAYLCIPKLFPVAAIANTAYVYVYEASVETTIWNGTGVNYFGISANPSINPSNFNKMVSTPAFTVQQAFSIDKKVDDGLPQTGRVIAVYLDADPNWSNGTQANNLTPTTTATSGSATTCYDNGNVGGTGMQYSVEQNNGSGMNCSLSFQFQ